MDVGCTFGEIFRARRLSASNFFTSGSISSVLRAGVFQGPVGECEDLGFYLSGGPSSIKQLSPFGCPKTIASGEKGLLGIPDRPHP